MSDFATGQESIEAQFDRTPMPEPPTDDTTFADAREAAQHLVEQREGQPETRPAEIIEYKARDDQGNPTDEKYDERAYVSAERAADDLRAFRDQRAEAAKQAELEAIRQIVDGKQAADEFQKPGGEAEQLESVQQWGDRITAEQQQQAAADADVIKTGREALRQLDQAIAGESDPNMIAGLQNKRAEVYQMTSEAELRQALKDHPIAYELEKEVARRTQAAQAQVQANLQQVAQAAEYARAAIFAEPEFAGLRADQIATAEQILARDNPVRHAELTERARSVQRLVQHGREMAAAQQQQQWQQFSTWADQQDKIWDKQNAHIPAQHMQELKDEAAQMLREAGLSPGDINQLWHTQPWFRSAAAQNIMMTAAEARLAKRGLPYKRAAPPAPQVLRPGGGDDLDLRAEYADAPRLPSQFSSAKDAAKFLTEIRSRRR